MRFDEYFRNYKYYNGIAGQVNADKDMLGTFQAALSQISPVPKYRGLLGAAKPDGMTAVNALSQKILDSVNHVTPLQTAVVGAAVSDGFVFEKGVEKVLRSAYAPMLKMRRETEGSRSSIEALLGTGFADRIKPAVYFGGVNVGVVNSVHQKTMIDKTWLKTTNPWLTQVSVLAQTDTDIVRESNSPFAKLVRLEKETGELLGKTGADLKMTSVSTQIASIFRTKNGSDSLMSSVGLLSDYNSFAIAQNKEIQRAVGGGKDRDAAWRLKLLDVTSKYVDRQIVQQAEITAALDEVEILDEEYGGQEDTISERLPEAGGWEEYKSPIALIPQEIGYSNRKDSSVTPEEALGRSNITTITELGFGIVNRVLEVNKLRQDMFQENVFRATDKVMRVIGKLGQFICDSEGSFSELINNLYFLIYENQSGIKEMLGDGDQSVGDKLIRGKEYECIFRIKDLRTDFDHDIEHGGDGKQQKKKKDIESAYRYYAKKRPATAKEYKQFQIKLYEDVILLIDRFIELINNRAEDEQ